jgi:hypothetical protein
VSTFDGRTGSASIIACALLRSGLCEGPLPRNFLGMFNMFCEPYLRVGEQGKINCISFELFCICSSLQVGFRLMSYLLIVQHNIFLYYKSWIRSYKLMPAMSLLFILVQISFGSAEI